MGALDQAGGQGQGSTMPRKAAQQQQGSQCCEENAWDTACPHTLGKVTCDHPE